jgi:pimeloyl-ACP methyl ester carboxylesterase
VETENRTVMRVESSAVQCQSVDLSHGQTRYLETGTGPAVILLHGVGWALGADAWRANIPGLASGLRVLAPDFPGWGPGDQLELGYSFAYLTDFVREFQDALGLEAAHVVGHSMGGWIASLLAYESPQRVGKLVLVASGGMATRPLPAMSDWAPPGEPEIRASMAGLEALGVDTAPLVKERVSLAGDPERAERFRRVMAHMTHPETRRRYHMARRLPHIPNSTLILWGTADAVNNIELGQETERLLPHAELRVFEGAGHNLPVERPAEFDQAVLDFLLR